MTQLLFWGFLMVLCGLMIWGIAKMGEATGEARAMREKAEKDTKDAKTAGTIVAEVPCPD